ncbi:TniQ family protein [Roseateles toxinivorans]|uniref:TniQ protein n=1 Tax=Roseateles toxinivorans TaxID=270368 RepID=A0A4R6QPQ5_9BURK|nr:TniQ family protein [Roseateles toxinivorans]TDP72986.1 TniQ protein [Roseateles toxinivorans]
MLLTKVRQLAYVPTAAQGESPSSWITRAALSQGVRIRAFTNFLGWKFAYDWDQDILFTRAFGHEVATMPELVGLSEATNLISALLVARAFRGSHLLYRSSGAGRSAPFSRYCVECLEEAVSPFFRVQWRFQNWRYCPKHECLLEDACPSCGIPPCLPISMMCAKRQGGILRSLKHCGKCGLLLTKLAPVTLQQARLAGISDADLATMQRVQAHIEEISHSGSSDADLPHRMSARKPEVFVESFSMPSTIIDATQARRRLGLLPPVAMPAVYPYPVADR